MILPGPARYIAGPPEVNHYAQHEPLANAAGLPPEYIEVGQLDMFRDEDIRYGLTLSRARACRSNCTCTPACRTSTTPSRPVPRCGAARKATATACCGACDAG